jgi:hypothetical protein
MSVLRRLPAPRRRRTPAAEQNAAPPGGRRRAQRGLVSGALFGLTVVLSLGLAGPVSAGPPPPTAPSVTNTAASALAPAATGTPLRAGTALYPRAIRLAHNGAANGRVLASVVTFDGNNGIGAIHESTDSGASFREVGRIADPESGAGQGLCCATLFELPQQVGALPAGTMLWASSAGQDEQNRRMALRIWRSNDVGRTWSYLSSCAVANGTGGLWEPEFSMGSGGALVCHYADETDPGHSQKLVAARSFDGLRWEGHHDTVASNLASDRPGMPVVRRLPNGTYFMSFEICSPGGQYQCVVHYRTSAGGWSWGDPASLGIRPQTADGRYFRAAPTIAWAPGGGANGRILLVGQRLLNRDGTVAAGSGRVLLTNTQNGTGAWQETPSPVIVPNPGVNPCQNYSSPLLPSADGSQVLQIATDYDGTVCRAYFASRGL